jgi:hypothetical protein
MATVMMIREALSVQWYYPLCCRGVSLTDREGTLKSTGLQVRDTVCLYTAIVVSFDFSTNSLFNFDLLELKDSLQVPGITSSLLQGITSLY